MAKESAAKLAREAPAVAGALTPGWENDRGLRWLPGLRAELSEIGDQAHGKWLIGPKDGWGTDEAIAGNLSGAPVI